MDAGHLYAYLARPAIILHVHFEYFTHTYSKQSIVLKHVHHHEAFTLGFQDKRFKLRVYLNILFKRCLTMIASP